MIRKVILIWFNNDELSDILLWMKIPKWRYIEDSRHTIPLRGYAYYFTQLYRNNGIFFDDIFKSIQEGIESNNNIKNIEKHRERWVIDCYSSLYKRVNRLMNELWWCLLVCNANNNEYDFIIDFLDTKKVYLDNEREVLHYLKWLHNKHIS